MAQNVTDRSGDQCQITRKCRGGDHTCCNSKVKQQFSSFILLDMHTMARYYSSFLFQDLITLKDPFIVFTFLTETEIFFDS